MSRWLFYLGVRLLAVTAFAEGSPVSELSSPSSEVRSRAAELIRDDHLYQATPRAPWDQFAATFKPGDSLQDVLLRLQKEGVSPLATLDMFPASGCFGFRLDDSWELYIAFKDSRLVEYVVREQPREVWVQPPAGYSGFWRTYRIDGTRCSFLDYRNGKCLGFPIR